MINLKKKKKLIALLNVTALISVSPFSSVTGFLNIGSMCLSSYAAQSDYEIGSCDWEYDDSTGRVTAVWDETAEKTSFVVDVYKGSISDKNKIRSTSLTSSSGVYSHDFTHLIAEKGTGNYYFTVYPKKGGESLIVSSDVLEVDSTMLTAIKAAANYSKTTVTHPNAGKAINLELKLGWKQNPNGTWRYRLSSSSYAKSQWLNINGKWYYFGADGIMLTGWQQINGKYYYFNKEGDLWNSTGSTSSSGTGSQTLTNNNLSNTNTSVLSKSDVGNVTYTSGTKNITSCSVTFKEENTTAGAVRPMTINVPSNVTLQSVYYSKQPETWQPGTKVEITLTLKAADGSQFGSGCKMTASNGTYKSQTGDAFTRTVKYEYTAKTKLAKPQKVYLDNSYILHWSKVNNASRYNVKIYYNEEYDDTSDSDMTLYTEDEDDTLTRSRSKSVTVNTNQIDVGDYIAVDEISEVKFVITAQASSGRSSYYLNSESVTFTASQGLVSSSNDTGSITSNNKGDMLYLGTDGTGITGWQDIDGAWYYFESKGVAAGPGWKKIDKEWFYFGDDHKMQVGWIQVGGFWYYLNEDSSAGTYGAMLTGTRMINGTTYNLNTVEGENGRPLGAWIE